MNIDFRNSISNYMSYTNLAPNLNINNSLVLNTSIFPENYFKDISDLLKPYSDNLASVINNMSIQTSLINQATIHTRNIDFNKRLLYLSSLLHKLELYYPDVNIDELSLDEVETLVYYYEYTTEFLALDKLQLTMFNAINTINDIPNSVSDGLNKVNTIIDNKIGRNNRYLLYDVCGSLITYQIDNGINAYFHNSTASLMINLFIIFIIHYYKISSPNNKDTDK